MAINKVDFGGNTLIDITDTTALAADVLAGKYFYTAAGIKTAGTGSGIEMESGTFTPSSAASRPTISFSKTHSAPPVLAVAGIQGFPSETSSAIAFYLIDFERILGFPVKYNSSTNRYGFVYCWYRGTGTTASGSAVTLQCGASNPGSGSNSYFRYYANESALMPYTNSGQRYWRSGIPITWKAYWL